VTGHERGESRPRLVACARSIGRPRQSDLHASESFGVDDVGHERGKRTVPTPAKATRQTHIEDHFEWWLFHRLLSNPDSFRAELASQTLGAVEDVLHFGDVILAVEEWSKSLQVELRTGAQRLVRLGRTVPDHKPPRAHSEE